MAKTQAPSNSRSSSAGSESVAGALEQAQAAVDQLARETQSGGLALPDLGGRGRGDSDSVDLDMLGDVELDVSVELGRTEMLVEDVLRLSEGSVLELDKLAGDPVDVYVNQRLVARGEVLVLNDNFCIRISEIVDDLKEQAVEAAAANAG